MNMNMQRAVILLVEDSPADQIIVQRAIEDGKVDCDLLIVDNGMEALKLLRGESPYDDRDKYPFPHLMLLDINMPVMDGRETLHAVREDGALKHLPVIMLTTSSRDKDVLDSYRLGVNAYITKPMNETAFVNAVMQLEKFWFQLVSLPSS